MLNARDKDRHYLVCRFREPGEPPRVYRIREIDADTRFTVVPRYFKNEGFVQRQQLWVTYNREGKRFLARLNLFGQVQSEEQLSWRSRSSAGEALWLSLPTGRPIVATQPAAALPTATSAPYLPCS